MKIIINNSNNCFSNSPEKPFKVSKVASIILVFIAFLQPLRAQTALIWYQGNFGSKCLLNDWTKEIVRPGGTNIVNQTSHATRKYVRG